MLNIHFLNTQSLSFKIQFKENIYTTLRILAVVFFLIRSDAYLGQLTQKVDAHVHIN